MVRAHHVTQSYQSCYYANFIAENTTTYRRYLCNVTTRTRTQLTYLVARKHLITSHKHLFTIIDMVISTHVLTLKHVTDTIQGHQFCFSGCDAYRRSPGRRSLYWLGRRYRACLAPQPSPLLVYLAVQANRNKVCAVRTVRGRKNGSRCLQASQLDRDVSKTRSSSPDSLLASLLSLHGFNIRNGSDFLMLFLVQFLSQCAVMIYDILNT